jgi:putative transposase
MEREKYGTDLTDREWELLGPLIPPAKPGGRPRSTDERELLNAIFYMLRAGGAWRLLPHDFGIPWETVYAYTRKWRQDGSIQRMHDSLRRQVRQRAGKEETPSAAILDSQSVKSTQKGGKRATTPASG